MCVDRGNGRLVEIELASRHSTREIVERYVRDPVARRIVTRALNDQVFRGLLELQLNGCTSFRLAKVLISEEMIRATPFKARTSEFRDEECDGIEISALGEARLWSEQEGLEENQWLGMLRGAVIGYVCIDNGQGICATRSFIETALELQDYSILKRLVEQHAGRRQFPALTTVDEAVDDEQRAAAAHWWSALEGVGRSGRILDLS